MRTKAKATALVVNALAASILTLGGGHEVAAEQTVQGVEPQELSGELEQEAFGPEPDLSSLPDPCIPGAIVDRGAPGSGTAYGGGWVNCSGWGSFEGVLTVNLYQDGVYVGSRACALSGGLGCDASLAVPKPAGQQAWRACAHYRVSAAEVWQTWEGSTCSSRTF